MIIRPLTGLIGAEITDLDLNNLDEASFQALDNAFAQHLVLCIRDQSLTPSDLVGITDRLGGPGETPYLTGLEEYPDVVPVIKEANESSPHTFGAGWHTDFTFQATPPAKTLLYAVDTPAAGGDTLYANMYAAYDALSDGMKAALKSLNAVHSATRSYGPQATLKNHLEHMTITNDDQEPDTQLHPVICMHPVTKRPALWINPTYTIRFENMTQEESKPLLDYLNQLIVSPQFCCRVRWQPGTLTLWDNRCTQHCATSDYQGHRREMWRTTVAGETPIAFA
ncbi:MAG: TauD/TfdA family dioxygenase [Gammaproteobacteria bacterium]|jgi:taurine dioxygenase|nr:TauD/TfdA family dioxygenase [Gammaproteobacteria bacterium]MBT5199057.1 TauD/TfdA family dioxygenase [Gammaproteobacteria bacterium]MBT6664474.1 TauD/TfdA family dioxygenase [Gammaproteobacteria bacterium]